jgi:hypothetical protein
MLSPVVNLGWHKRPQKMLREQNGHSVSSQPDSGVKLTPQTIIFEGTRRIMTEDTATGNFADQTDPDWDMPLTIKLTPELIVHALMQNAAAVHTGWESCIDDDLALSQLVAMDDAGSNAVRLVEQEFMDEQEEDLVWHDWALEVRIGKVITTGHFSLRVNSPPLDWEWHAREAENAFDRACVLIGRRVRRGLVIEEPMPRELPPRASRH